MSVSEDATPYSDTSLYEDIDLSVLDVQDDDLEDDGDEDDDDDDLGATRYDSEPEDIEDAADDDDDDLDDPDFSDELPGVPLIQKHRDYLINEAGISEDYIDSEFGQRTIRSITDISQVPRRRRKAFKRDGDEPVTGLWFGNFQPHTGKSQWQVRPDRPSGSAKYLSRSGGGSAVGLTTPPPKTPLHGHTVIIQEGTKQARAVASALRHDSDYLVVCAPGVQNWTTDGHLHQVIEDAIEGAAEIFIVPDADAGVKPQVYDGAEGLKKALLDRFDGSRNKIRFVHVPGGGSTGMDDALAKIDEPERAAFVKKLLKRATSKPADREPSARRRRGDDNTEVVYFDRFGGGLKVKTCVDALYAKHTYGYSVKTKELAIYDNAEGVFSPVPLTCENDPEPIADFLSAKLGEDFRTEHIGHVKRAFATKVRTEGYVIPETPTHGLLAVTNGMVDLRTGELLPHDPKYCAVTKLNVEYDADATCPTIEAWIREATRYPDGSDQLDALIDTTSTLLDCATSARKPDRGLYLIGPTRAGKGTYMNGLIETLVPEDYRSALTLENLASRKDAYLVELRGKIVNLAGETAEGYVHDSSMLKSALGGDSIFADVKYKRAAKFHNSAFLIFSANDPPYITDTSGAVGARLTFVQFTQTHEGREDRDIATRLQAELPGFLNLLIAAWRARYARGLAYLPSSPQATALFIKSTNPIADFMDDCIEVAPESAWLSKAIVADEWTIGKREIYSAYSTYCRDTNRKPLNSRNFYKAISRKPFNIAGLDGNVYSDQTKTRRLACRLKDEED